MGSGQTRIRYIGGKVPQKYFSEEMWPKSEEYLRKLSIDESRGFELFKIFCKIDTDQSASLDVDECMAYFGGRRTRFTERVFDTIEIGNEKEGLNFVDFAFTMWNFCTLNSAGLARYVYEIFDVDFDGFVEGGDIGAMYRMIYDAEEHDTKIVTTFPLDNNGKITKEKFIKYVKSKKSLIKPVIEYQSRLRKCLGGLIMWEQLTGYRKRNFAVHDQKSRTLDEAFVAIINSPNPYEKEPPLTATEKIIMEQDKIRAAAEAAQHQLAEFERIRADERKKALSTQEDRAMNLAWMALEAKKHAFEALEFTTSNIMERKEERDQLYVLYDRAVEITKQFWVEKYRKQDFQAFGTPADKEARINDYLRTKDGAKDFERVKLICTLQATEKRLQSISSGTAKSAEDIRQIANQIAYIQKGNLNLEGALKIQRKFTKKIDLEGIEEKAKAEFAEYVVQKHIEKMNEDRAETIEERERDFKRKEFAIATKYGSRHTRWETVLDTQHDKMVTINVDTLRILGEKACVCEMCDKTIEQNDIECFHCKAPRSVKNKHLYKPLGAL